MAMTEHQRALVEKARKAAAEYREREAAKLAAQQAAPVAVPAQTTEVVTLEAAHKQTIISRVFTGSGFVPTVTGMVYNDEQSQAVELAMRGKSLCMIGAAGTGKTTTTREVVGQLQQMSHVGMFEESTTYLQKGTPAIIVVSFTNKAVNNIKKQLPKQLQSHCITMHKVLEFMPIRDADGKIIGFGPTYDRNKRLPYIGCVIFEESSMISTELYAMYRAALPDGCEPQEIFLGDLNQLPPVFGAAILGFKLIELPTIELVQIYRQALESPIISLAHRVREGKTFNWKPDEAGNYLVDAGEHGRVQIRPWKSRKQELAAVKTMGAVLLQYMDADQYDPEEDIVLCPFNVKFGCIALNKIIADRLTKDRGELTWEIIARGQASYWAIGDKILFDQQECKILDIREAPGYCGRIPQEESLSLDRDGRYHDHQVHNKPKSELDLLDELENSPIGERDKNAASHIVKIEYVDSGQVRELTASGDINKMLLGYVITVHKSQGSEWRRVFIALHYTHNVSITRELMYTAITRARHELIMFIDPGREGSMDSITKAARTPEIKGVTLSEKAEFFKGKAKEYQQMIDRHADEDAADERQEAMLNQLARG